MTIAGTKPGRSGLLKEITGILLFASIVGIAYGAITGKGLFADRSPTPASTSGTGADPMFIAYEEAHSLHQRGDALFVDARHEFDYTLGHIPGAISIPLKEFDQKLERLTGVPHNRVLVIYCDGAECNSSIEVALKLQGVGFTNVKMFFGGWGEWQSHGGPGERSGQ